MKVAIVSHSYLEVENQKNILALDEFCEVLCILPRKGAVLIFPEVEFKADTAIRHIFAAYYPFQQSKGQYLLLSPTLGLRHFRPDIINVEYNPWSLLFFQVLLYRRIYSPQSKLVCTIKKNTFSYGHGIIGRTKRWLAQFGVRQVDHVIAASKMVSNLCESEFSMPARKISMCHHLGVDISLFNPIIKRTQECIDVEKPIIVGYCGRFDAEKGLKDLVEAIRLVRQTLNKTVVLRLMGRGAYNDFLDDYLLNEARKVDWLELLPPVPHSEVANFLRVLDIFVLPARILQDHQEHDAHAMIEAMACGVACIGTKSGIIPEILGNGAGWLVNPQHPENLCEALRFLINSVEERRIIALRGREKAVKEFDLRVVAKRKSDIFRGIVHEKKSNLESNI